MIKLLDNFLSIQQDRINSILERMQDDGVNYEDNLNIEYIIALANYSNTLNIKYLLENHHNTVNVDDILTWLDKRIKSTKESLDDPKDFNHKVSLGGKKCAYYEVMEFIKSRKND